MKSSCTFELAPMLLVTVDDERQFYTVSFPSPLKDYKMLSYRRETALQGAL